MRIWDLPPQNLCKDHLLGEHRELHAIWSILTNNKKGYSRHPEVIRWQGKLAALYLRHEDEVAEIKFRGYQHYSPLDKGRVAGLRTQNELIDSITDQKKILKEKNCLCIKKQCSGKIEPRDT